MKPITGITLLVFTLLLFSNFNFIYAQNSTNIQYDAVIKDSIYNNNRLNVLNFSSRDFDALFFEFFDKKAAPTILSKREFYSYTICIAIYSERLAALYPNQKAIATESKNKWFAESYTDYVKTKKL